MAERPPPRPATPEEIEILFHGGARHVRTPQDVVAKLVRKGWHGATVFYEGSRKCRRLGAGLIRGALAELRALPSLPFEVAALAGAVDPDLPDEALEQSWQTSIDRLRVLYDTCAWGTARERERLLDVARDAKLVAAMRRALDATEKPHPTAMAVFLAEGSPESRALVERLRNDFDPKTLRALASFAGALDAPAPAKAARPKRADPFWRLVDEASEAGDPAEALRDLLDALSPSRIAAFARALDDTMRRAYRWDLWGAAYLALGGCSDDAFRDFRAALVGKGRDVYERVLADPDALVEHPDVEGDEAWAGVAREVYADKTGKELPDGEPEPAAPAGARWDFDDDDEMRRRYPRLHARAKGR